MIEKLVDFLEQSLFQSIPTDWWTVFGPVIAFAKVGSEACIRSNALVSSPKEVRKLPAEVVVAPRPIPFEVGVSDIAAAAILANGPPLAAQTASGIADVFAITASGANIFRRPRETL